MDAGAVLVDIRAESQRARDGVVPGSVFIARNVLEWRCDPDGSHRDERVADPSAPLIVMCDAGYQSSLAAATLHELGHDERDRPRRRLPGLARRGPAGRAARAEG